MASPSFAPTIAPTPGPSLGAWSPAWTIQPVAPRFDVVWHRVAGADLPTFGTKITEVDGHPSMVELNGRYVVAYRPSTGGPGPHIWHSTDLVHWRRAIPQSEWLPRVHASQVVRGGPGLVALGTDNLEGSQVTKPALWRSSDGRSWDRVPKATLPPVQWLFGGPNGLVAFGADTWTSGDGLDWQPVGASPFEGNEIGGAIVLEVGNSALVFKQRGDDQRAGVYRLDPNGLWQDLGDIPESTGTIYAAVLGPQGIVVVGSSADDPRTVWRSPDAIEWQRATRPPRDLAMNDRLYDLAATASGYVAVYAHIYFEGCAGGIGGAQIPETWASSDGLRWHRVADDGTQDHQALSKLIGQGDKLVAVGLRWLDSGFDGAAPTLWQAEIRQVSSEPIPSPVPGGGGCH